MNSAYMIVAAALAGCLAGGCKRQTPGDDSWFWHWKPEPYGNLHVGLVNNTGRTIAAAVQVDDRGVFMGRLPPSLDVDGTGVHLQVTPGGHTVRARVAASADSAPVTLTIRSGDDVFVMFDIRAGSEGLRRGITYWVGVSTNILGEM